jgi:catalase
VSVFAAVDQGFSDRVAKAIGLPPVKPVNVKPAAEAVKFKPKVAAKPVA